MGFLKGGPFYHLTGKVGNNVGRIINGKNVFSMMPTGGNRTPSAAQLNIQRKLTLVSEWMSEVTEIIRVGFDDHPQGMSAWNAALRYNIVNAVTGISPDFTINYPKVVFSDGKLAKAKNVAVAATEAGQLDFTWLGFIPALKKGDGTDQLLLLVYNPAQKEWEASIGDAVRSDLSYDLLLPAEWSGDSVHVWASMLSADNDLASTTQYAGAFSVI